MDVIYSQIKAIWTKVEAANIKHWNGPETRREEKNKEGWRTALIALFIWYMVIIQDIVYDIPTFLPSLFHSIQL